MWHHLKQALFSGIVLGIALLSGLLIYAHLQGESLLSVQTTSMVPTLTKGTLVSVARIPSDKLRVGDIVTYRSPVNPKETITHRIVETPNRANNYHFLTKGDANAVHDTPILSSAILGQVHYHVPYLGYVTDFLRKPLGLLLIIYIPALWIIWDEAKRLAQYYREQSVRLIHYLIPGYRSRLLPSEARGSHGFAKVISLLIISVLGVGYFALPASAQLNSQAVLTNNTISTIVLTPPPNNNSCTSNTTVNITSTSSQSSSTGNANVSGNTGGGNATSGNASNSNSTTINGQITGC